MKNVSKETKTRITTDENGKLTVEVEDRDIYIWFNENIISAYYIIKFKSVDDYWLDFTTISCGKVQYHHLPVRLFCEEQIEYLKTLKEKDL